MGSTVSAILANLVMERVKERALITAPILLSGGIDTSIDDSHVCIAREHLTEFHSHLNSINEHKKKLQWKKKMTDPSHFWAP